MQFHHCDYVSIVEFMKAIFFVSRKKNSMKPTKYSFIIVAVFFYC